MDLLESKYFEKPISLLKKIKEEEIFIRDDFKDELKINLINQIDEMNGENKTNWLEVVFKIKYLLLGVPVLFVFTVLFANTPYYKTDLINQSGVLPKSSSEEVLSRSLSVEKSKIDKVIEGDLYINDDLGENFLGEKCLKFGYNIFNFSGVYLDQEHVCFDGEERDSVIEVLNQALFLRNGNLSYDYQIKVLKLNDGNYKAFLYEYGKVKTVLVLGYRAGLLMVLTEFVYG